MDSKKWYQSKTIIAGILTAVIGAAQSIGLLFSFDLLANPIMSVVITILGALGVYGRSVANKSIE